ncbi:hypothetical protein NCCNTM_28780 [Mycolicibacterium sp. NCC-Tsukiji]|nr:hypothetical protein NCCNTM_28780 [Mycolicibacterium sp. NCC-Tsukiji]
MASGDGSGAASGALASVVSSERGIGSAGGSTCSLHPANPIAAATTAIKVPRVGFTGLVLAPT